MLSLASHHSHPRHPASGPHLLPPADSCNLDDPIEMIGSETPFARNSEIYHENESAEYIYKVVSGAVRTYKILSDGRRQVCGFYLPGDVFGLESGDEHTFSAGAITASNVMIVKRSTLFSLAARDANVTRKLLALTSDELQRLQDHSLVLIKTAQERVAGFLLEMAARGAADNQVELPMSRQDIADYLGLTIETVSRTLSQLQNSAAIDLPNSRRIVLRNRAALGRLNA